MQVPLFYSINLAGPTNTFTISAKEVIHEDLGYSLTE